MTSLSARCPSCMTEFALDPEKVPAEGARVTCSICSAVITIPAVEKEEDEQRNNDRVEFSARITSQDPNRSRSATPTRSFPRIVEAPRRRPRN